MNASAHDELAFIAVRKTTDTADIVGWGERGVGRQWSGWRGTRPYVYIHV